jgi:hypothetical protein
MLKTGYVATTQRHVFGVAIGLAFCRSKVAQLGSTINLKKKYLAGLCSVHHCKELAICLVSF